VLSRLRQRLAFGSEHPLWQGGYADRGTPLHKLVLQFPWRAHFKGWTRARQGRLFAEETFQLESDQLAYFDHRYNFTWLNERRVEIPIAMRFLEGGTGVDLLEVGNVLGHYGIRGHAVLDRYESGPGVVNEDLLEYRPRRRFPRIVSISTIEHIGVDEGDGQATRAVRSLEHLRTLLAPGGRLLVTVPAGYNTALDRHLREEARRGAPVLGMRRIARANRWRQVPPEEALACRYGWPYMNANGLLVVTG
jgi:hypothetical protein